VVRGKCIRAQLGASSNPIHSNLFTFTADSISSPAHSAALGSTGPQQSQWQAVLSFASQGRMIALCFPSRIHECVQGPNKLSDKCTCPTVPVHCEHPRIRKQSTLLLGLEVTCDAACVLSVNGYVSLPKNNLSSVPCPNACS